MIYRLVVVAVVILAAACLAAASHPWLTFGLLSACLVLMAVEASLWQAAASRHDSAQADGFEAFQPRRMKMGDDQIKHMVSRFLCWKLPENFHPDAGISFKAEFNENTDHPMRHQPVGTNLLDAAQAEAMIRHLVSDLPQ
jgi:hypothetical protein